MWSVSVHAPACATFEGVLIPSIAPTAPPRRVGPCMQLASSSTTPSSLGKPAVAHAGIVRIQFDDIDAGDHRIQRIAARL